jgi:hypothetical protein
VYDVACAQHKGNAWRLLHSFSLRPLDQLEMKFSSDMRCTSAHHRYYYIRITSNGQEHNDDTSSERYDVVDINDVSSHIELFKKQVPHVNPSYMIHTHTKNADAPLITALHESNCIFNLNSIVDVRNVVGILGHTHSCCFAASVKSQFHIKEAVNLGINRMTVSYPAEVLRISAVSKTIELVLQISPSSVNSIVKKDTAGAQKSSWTKILQTANSKGMKVTGIALGRSTCSDYANESERIAQTFSNVLEAFELASQHGHSVSFVDLGCLISDLQRTYPSHDRCSTIMEEVGDEDDCSNDEEHQCAWESDDRAGEEDAFLTTLFEMYLPHSLGLQVYAQHAQYLVPDHTKIIKWWSTPKTRRPTPSLHSFLAAGCSSNTKSMNRNAYRSRKQQTITSSNILKNPPAAAQA